MDVEVTPEPEADEREAMLAALDSAGADSPSADKRADESPWRRAGLHEAVEDLDP